MSRISTVLEEFGAAPVRGWHLGKLPLCPTCRLMCIVYCSRRERTGVRIQYRKCPKCGHMTKNRVTPKAIANASAQPAASCENGIDA